MGLITTGISFALASGLIAFNGVYWIDSIIKTPTIGEAITNKLGRKLVNSNSKDKIAKLYIWNWLWHKEEIKKDNEVYDLFEYAYDHITSGNILGLWCEKNLLKKFYFWNSNLAVKVANWCAEIPSIGTQLIKNEARDVIELLPAIIKRDKYLEINYQKWYENEDGKPYQTTVLNNNNIMKVMPSTDGYKSNEQWCQQALRRYSDDKDYKETEKKDTETGSGSNLLYKRAKEWCIVAIDKNTTTASGSSTKAK